MLLGGLPIPADATDVALAGVFPGKALMVINAGAPRTTVVGATTPEGVKVIAVDSEGALVEVDGRRQRLFVGQQAVHVSGGAGKSPMAVIHSDSRGQFNVVGSIDRDFHRNRSAFPDTVGKCTPCLPEVE